MNPFNEKTMKQQIYNLIILDESGSMGCVTRQTLNGCNETLNTIRTRTLCEHLCFPKQRKPPFPVPIQEPAGGERETHHFGRLRSLGIYPAE